MVKNKFGFPILFFTTFNVIDKSYRKVLTPVNNSQLLLKLEILNKFIYKPQNTTQRKLATLSGPYKFQRNGSSHDLEPQSVDIMTLAA
jgi:hypothetical protein